MRQPPGFVTQLSDFWATNTQPPVRDRYDLYQRLGSPAQPGDGTSDVSVISHQTTKPPLKVGDSLDLQVLDIRSAQTHTIKATVQAITTHLYMLTDVAFAKAINNDALQAAAHTFEDKIYLTDHANFGEEWNPGVDGDPHLLVLNTPLTEGIIGYFSGEDEIVRPVSAISNEREMVYMGLPLDGTPTRQQLYESTLAHEFQHMIEWRQHGQQDSWLNEGSSVLAEMLNGYPAYTQAVPFLTNPNVQLTSWACTNGCNVLAHYGAGFLFANYLNQRFGQAMTRAAVAGTDTTAVNAGGPSGSAAVERALLSTQLSFDLTFDTVFQDWVISNALLSKPNATKNSRYSVPNLAGQNLNLTLSANSSYPLRVHDTVEQYAARYYPVTLPSGDRVFSLNFSGNQSTAFTDAPAIPSSKGAPQTGRLWWSGRGDNSDSTLTRNLDLCALKNGQCTIKQGQKLSLQFSSWYETEPRYDFGYVEVSTDGGAHWRTLPTKYTRAAKDDPPNANYGNGLTGRSDPNGQRLTSPATDPNPPLWVLDQADLSAYGGQQIMLRFEYVTDDSYNLSGWMLGNITIPEIGFTDDPEAETAGNTGEFGADFPTTLGLTDLSTFGSTPIATDGWMARGFIRTTNTIPQKWFVQVIAVDDAGHATVTPVPRDATQTGAINLDSSQGKNLIVVVAAGAPLSLVAPAFDLSLTEKGTG